MSESPTARIQQLKELVEHGLMSPEEYEASRKAIIEETTGVGAKRAHSVGLGGHTQVGAPDGLAGVQPAASPLMGGTQVGGSLAPSDTSGRAALPEVPATLGNYQVLGVLGAGGMGTVVRARHAEEGWAAEQGGDVAIKLIHPEIAADESFRSRFFAEASLGKRVQHPALATVYDVVSEGPWLGTILELIEGEDLTARIRPGGLSLAEAVHLLGPLADALDHLHAQGIVHRDLKPANVKVRPNGNPVLLDLGIAKDLQRDTDAGHKTQAMTAMGTSAWMAPEQADARTVTGAADRYALGLIAYALLSGRMPWPEETTALRALTNKMVGQLTPLSEAKSGLPGAAYAAVDRMLSLDPAARQDSAADFLSELQGERTAAQRTAAAAAAAQDEAEAAAQARAEAAKQAAAAALAAEREATARKEAERAQAEAAQAQADVDRAQATQRAEAAKRAEAAARAAEEAEEAEEAARQRAKRTQRAVLLGGGAMVLAVVFGLGDQPEPAVPLQPEAPVTPSPAAAAPMEINLRTELPVWVVCTGGHETREAAEAQAQSLRDEGLPGHVFYLPEYPETTSGADFWITYAGPYPYTSGDTRDIRTALRQVQSTRHKDAYALKIADHGKREQISRP